MHFVVACCVAACNGTPPIEPPVEARQSNATASQGEVATGSANALVDGGLDAATVRQPHTDEDLAIWYAEQLAKDSFEGAAAMDAFIRSAVAQTSFNLQKVECRKTMCMVAWTSRTNEYSRNMSILIGPNPNSTPLLISEFQKGVTVDMQRGDSTTSAVVYLIRKGHEISPHW